MEMFLCLVSQVLHGALHNLEKMCNILIKITANTVHRQQRNHLFPQSLRRLKLEKETNHAEHSTSYISVVT